MLGSGSEAHGSYYVCRYHTVPAGSKHMLKYMLNPKFCEHYFQGLMRKNEYFKKNLYHNFYCCQVYCFLLLAGISYFNAGI